LFHQITQTKSEKMATQKDRLIEKLISRIAAQSTEMLKDVAKKLMTNFEEGAAVSFKYVLDELERRMPEPEYVEFCDNL